jgi:hypothetical protein
MIWFFTRGSAQIDIEVRRISDPDGYELVVDYSDGEESVERFTNPRRLVERTLTLQRQLIGDGWMPSGPGMYGVRAKVRPARESASRAGPALGLRPPHSLGAPGRNLRAIAPKFSRSV